MRIPLSFALVFAATSLGGCAATPGERLKADVGEMRAEHTPQKLFDRGRGFASIGDYTRAEEYLSAALEAGANPRKVMPELLRVCVADNRYRSVLQYAEGYLPRYPDDVSTRFVYGTVLYATGDFKRAKTELKRVTTDRPLLADAHFALAVADVELGQHLEADTHFREYLRLEPKGARALEAQANLTRVIVPTEEPKTETKPTSLP